MAHIVFNVFSAVSHYNSTFNVALLLKSHGHHITYISDSDEYREHVTLKGFSFYKYTYKKYLYQHPFRSLLDFALLVWKNKWLESYIASLNRAKAFERAALDETLFDKIVLEIKPDLVIFDGALYLNALIFKKHSIPLLSAHCGSMPIFSQGHLGWAKAVVERKMRDRSAFKRNDFD